MSARSEWYVGTSQRRLGQGTWVQDFAMKDDRFGRDNGGEAIGAVEGWQVPHRRRSLGITYTQL